MPSLDPDVRVIVGKIAATERHHPNADTSELHRDLRAASLAEHIRKAVDSAPPLTDDQKARLAALLAPAVKRHDLPIPLLQRQRQPPLRRNHRKRR